MLTSTHHLQHLEPVCLQLFKSSTCFALGAALPFALGLLFGAASWHSVFFHCKKFLQEWAFKIKCLWISLLNSSPCWLDLQVSSRHQIASNMFASCILGIHGLKCYEMLEVRLLACALGMWRQYCSTFSATSSSSSGDCSPAWDSPAHPGCGGHDLTTQCHQLTPFRQVNLKDLIWLDMTWYDLIWLDMAWYDLIWLDMTWYSMTWHDLTWFGMICWWWWW